MIMHEKWPSKLKIQVIRPIHKKGSRTDLDNYRPIALLPVINKIIEKYFTMQIQAFLTKHNHLSNKQYGFRQNRSTVDALKRINDLVTNALNQGKYVGATLIDLQKAFDTINHKILIEKCKKVGLRGKILNVIKSYLSDRRACTRLNDEESAMNNVTFGVPQGSVLGPLLFLIYINDIEDEIESTIMLLFADDIIILSINYDYKQMMANLQTDFDSINAWFIENEVYISETKTVNMTIKTPHMKTIQKVLIYIHSDNCKYLKLGVKGACSKTCTAVEDCVSSKYLGLTIDSNWKHTVHIEGLITKLRQQIPKLYQVRNILNNKNKLMLYYAWVESHLRYGIEVFGFAQDYLVQRLQRVQNKIVKLLFKTNDTQSTKELYKKFGILNIRKLRDYIVVQNNFFDNEFKTVKTKQVGFLRDTSLRLNVPLWRNQYGLRNRQCYVPKIFNNLPQNVKSITNFNTLKRELKLWMLEQCD
jgi:hypothetical protein